MAHVLRSHTCKDFDVKFLTEVISSAVPCETVVTKILKTEILGLQQNILLSLKKLVSITVFI